MNQSEQLYHTAQLFELQNNMDAALDCYRKIVALTPTAASCYNLGIKLYENGHIDKAIESFCHTISFNPKDSDAYYNLGLALFDQKKYKESVVCFKKALEYGDTSSANTHYCLGNALQALGKISEAISCYKKAITLAPNYLKAHLNLGTLYKNQGKIKKAISSFQQASNISPDNIDLLFCLAHLHKKNGDNNNARNCYRQIINIAPDNSVAYRKIGDTLYEQGHIEKAIKYFEKSLTITPDHGLEVRSALALPVINESQTTIKCYRQRLNNKINQLINRNIKLTDPLKEVGNTNFLLSYHNLNNRYLQQKIASLYLKICPSLGWSALNCNNQRIPTGKIKIGFISTFLHSHTIGYLFYGIIKRLSKKKFYKVIFRFPSNRDPLSTAIDQTADEIFNLPYKLDQARKIIAKSALDILFYLDIGMDPITYFLAFSRLAAVQCMTYGHPETSGIPNMDYFISFGKSSETDKAEQYYSEQLVLIESFNLYHPPPTPIPIKQRKDFNLPLSAKLYICPQSLFKFHPDFDHILAAILRNDPNGTLVLIAGRESSWTDLLRNRFSQKFSVNELARVVILPRMSAPDFLSLCILADAVIDTPGFSGGKTSLDCFALGLPIITLPGQFMRSRLTFAQYKLMGISDCIAENENDFIKLAIRLAHDSTWKTKISKKIEQKSQILFNNPASVKELESFFKQAVNKAHSNSKKIDHPPTAYKNLIV